MKIYTEDHCLKCERVLWVYLVIWSVYLVYVFVILGHLNCMGYTDWALKGLRPKDKVKRPPATRKSVLPVIKYFFSFLRSWQEKSSWGNTSPALQRHDTKVSCQNFVKWPWMAFAKAISNPGSFMMFKMHIFMPHSCGRIFGQWYICFWSKWLLFKFLSNLSKHYAINRRTDKQVVSTRNLKFMIMHISHSYLFNTM